MILLLLRAVHLLKRIPDRRAFVACICLRRSLFLLAISGLKSELSLAPVGCGRFCRDILQELWAVILAPDIALAQQVQDTGENVRAAAAKAQEL